MSTTETENKELMHRVNQELYSEGNLDFIDDYIADEYVEHNTSSPEPVRGPEEYRENVRMLRNAFPDMEVTTEHVIADGDKVVNHWTVHGTHEGEMMGIEPTGREVEFSGISIAKMEDGKVVEGWTNVDVFGMLQQLGVVDAPGE